MRTPNSSFSMTAPPKNQHHQASSSRPLKNPRFTHIQSPNPNNPNNPNFAAATSPILLSQRDQVLSRASHLTRHELLKRRSYNLKQLSRCYRDHYWALMEELKIQYRDYYWKFGVSPFKQDHHHQNHDQNALLPGTETAAAGANDVNIEVIAENNNGNYLGSNFKGDLDLKSFQRCLFVGCKLKAMALTSFCHLHILSDAKQKLYKPCGYVIKSAHAGPITCGKPILRSAVPSLCSVHFQKAQKHVTRALKKAGLNVSSSSKLAPKFHVIVAEYVQQIQAKRKAAKRGNRSKGLDKRSEC